MDLTVDFIRALFTVYTLIVLIRVLLSWMPSSPIGRFWRAVYDFFHQTTDWYLGFFRRIIPMVGPVDISAIAALLTLTILQGLTISILESF